MNYVLVLVLSTNIQTVGSFNDQSSCQQAAKEFQAQSVKAVCVQQESPEQAIRKMQTMMQSMIENMPK